MHFKNLFTGAIEFLNTSSSWTSVSTAAHRALKVCQLPVMNSSFRDIILAKLNNYQSYSISLQYILQYITLLLTAGDFVFKIKWNVFGIRFLWWLFCCIIEINSLQDGLTDVSAQTNTANGFVFKSKWNIFGIFFIPWVLCCIIEVNISQGMRDERCGVLCPSGQLLMSGCQVKDCSTAIEVGMDGHARITDSTISFNQVGLCVEGHVLMHSCRIWGNVQPWFQLSSAPPGPCAYISSDVLFRSPQTILFLLCIGVSR